VPEADNAKPAYGHTPATTRQNRQLEVKLRKAWALETTNARQETIASTIAHKMTHQNRGMLA